MKVTHIASRGYSSYFIISDGIMCDICDVSSFSNKNEFRLETTLESMILVLDRQGYKIRSLELPD